MYTALEGGMFHGCEQSCVERQSPFVSTKSKMTLVYKINMLETNKYSHIFWNSLFSHLKKNDLVSRTTETESTVKLITDHY